MNHSIQTMRKTALVKTLAATVFVAGCFFAGGAQAQVYMNATVGGQFAPGVYGQISIGSAPPPPVINAQPIIVGTPVYGAPVMYLHVPDKETHDWRRYCQKYNACGRPVHFVQVDPKNRWWEARPEARHEEMRHEEVRHEEMRHDEMRHDEHDRRMDEGNGR